MNQPDQTTQGSPQNNSGRKNSSIIYWVIILVLLVACVFLVMSKNKMKDENDMAMKQKQETIDSVRTDRASLQSDFDAASAKIDQLVTQNSKLDSALQGDKAEMAKLQSKIKGILANKNATDADLKHAREMINELTDRSKQLEMRIAELEKQNTELTGQNKVLTQERDSTVEKNVALKKVGSVLHASNIRMEPIHKRKNGKEKQTTKAKRVDELRITFDIDENRIAESGTKDLYLRIKGPDGKVLSSTANASGTINTTNGDQLNYSVLKQIPLVQNQPVKDVTVDWHQDGDYPKGAYTIEIYSEGYMVGNGSVALR